MTNLPPRPVVTFRARRETLVLMASAAAVTLLLANAVHHRPAPAETAALEPTQWVGTLADPLSPSPAHTPEPLTSASLVVPRTTLARAPAAKIAAGQQTRRCDPATCQATAIAASPVKPAAATTARSEPKRATKTGWFNGGLNSLKHLPDVVRHPFDVAGDAVSGWISRL